MAGEGGINYLKSPWLVIRWRQEKRERDEVLLSRCGGLRTRKKPENPCLDWNVAQECALGFLRTPAELETWFFRTEVGETILLRGKGQKDQELLSADKPRPLSAERQEQFREGADQGHTESLHFPWARASGWEVPGTLK